MKTTEEIIELLKENKGKVIDPNTGGIDEERAERARVSERRIIQQQRENSRRSVKEKSNSMGPTIQPVQEPQKPTFQMPVGPRVPTREERFNRNIQDVSLSNTLGYPAKNIPQVATFYAAEQNLQKEIQQKKKQAEELTASRPALESERDEIMKREAAWYDQEAYLGRTFGYEGYDRYVDHIDPDGTTEHGQAKRRLDEIARLLALEQNPENTASLEDSARMYKDLQEIAKLPEDQREILRKYATQHYSGISGNYKTKIIDAYGFKEKSETLKKSLGNEKMEKLAESYARYLNQQAAENTQQFAEQVMDADGAMGNVQKAGANILTIPAQIVGAVTGATDVVDAAIKRLFRGSQYNSLDPNLPGYNASGWAGAVRGEATKEINETVPGFAGKALSTVYSATMSAADNLARIITTGGAGSLALAGMGSFASGVQESSERGGSPVKSLAMGVASGALEVLTEKVSLDRLVSAKSPETIADLLKNAAIQGGVEVSEEEASLAGNLLFEAIIMGDQSESQIALQKYLQGGMSLEEAQKNVIRDNLEQAAETAASSFLSGGFMSAGQGITQLQNSRIGQASSSAQQNVSRSQPEPVTQGANTGTDQTPQTPHELSVEDVDTAISQLFQTPAQEVDEAALGAYNSLAAEDRTAWGAEGETYTNDNKPIAYRWAVVPAESLIVSHDSYGNANPAYPQEMQPRDRTRATSQLQIGKMAKNLNPALLENSPTAQNGAPIVRGDGVVIGGNARAQAISSAYQNGSADNYSNYIFDHAEEFGIDPDHIPENPVLIRVPKGDANWSQLASSLNTSTTTSYSAVESAENDASKISDIISLLEYDESGNLNSKKNRNFVQAFIEKVVPEAERGRVVTSTGALSQEGLRRAQNAVFSFAYQDAELLSRLAEDLDNDTKNVTNALLAVAPQAASARESAQRISGHEVNLTETLKSAVQLYLEAKSDGSTVSDIANQESLLNQYSSSEVALAVFIEKNKRSGTQLRQMFSSIFQELETYGTPDQESMFPITPQEADVMKGAMARYEKSTGRSPGSFDESFDASRKPKNSQSNAAERTGRPVSNQPNSVESHDALHGGDVQRESSARKSVEADDSTGAAPKGFDPYTGLQYETGNKAEGANAARPVNVPNRDSFGRRVSDVAANAYGARVTPDSFIPEIEQMVLDGTFGADTKTNRETLENAASEISQIGRSAMRNRIAKAAASGKFNEDDIAAAQLLFTRYVNNKSQSSQEHAAEVLTYLSEMGRTAGRSLQIYKMFRKLTPSGQIQTVNQEISRYAEKVLGNQGKAKKVSIPDSLVEKFLKSDENTRSDVLNEIYENAAAQIPGTLKEKWDAWRYFSMLGNAKTHIRNVLGNAVFGRFVDIKRGVGAALELALPKEQRRKSVLGLGKESRALLNWAKADAKTEDAENLFSFTGRTGDQASSKMDEYRKIFKFKPLEWITKKNGKLLEAEDLFFKRSTYASSLAGFLKAKGYTISDVESGNVPANVLTEGRAYSAQEALKATFNDTNAFSEWVSGLGRKKTGNQTLDAIKSVAAEGIIPFRKTPANILVRGVEYSPAGLLKSGYQYFAKVRTGKMSASECMDSLSAGLTGTGVYALGALLAGLGIVTGGAISDDEDREGHQPYALEIGDFSVTLDWMAPAAMPFFMGVETQKALDEEYGDVSAIPALLYGMGNAAEPMLELSCLSSLNDLIDNVRYADDDKKLWSLAISGATSYFTQALPTLFGQFDQAADETRKTVYTTSSDPVVKELQRLGGKIFQKLPGDFNQTEYRDAWGRTESKGNVFQRIFNAFINPAYTSRIQETEADQEVSRLAEATGENMTPRTADRKITVKTEDGSKTINLTAEQWDQLSQTQGSVSYDLVSKMLSQEAYKTLSDQGKTKAIELAYNYARELGRVAALPEWYPEPSDSWMQSLDGDTGDAAIKEILRKASASDVGASSAEMYDKAAEAGFSNTQMKKMFSAVSQATSQLEDATNYDKYRAVLSNASEEDAATWLEVYGMSASQLEGMKSAESKGFTKVQYLDALEVNSNLNKAFDSVRDGADSSVLDEAYKSLQEIHGNSLSLAQEQFSARVRAFVQAKSAGMSSERFLVSYRKYQSIQDNSSLSASQKAQEWSYYLDKISLQPREKAALQDNLGFSTVIKQDSGKYGDLTSAGLDAEKAKAVTNLMSGLTPKPGSETVSNIQKFSAIADMNLDPQDEEIAIRAYMPDNMVDNYKEALDLGLDTGDWVELYEEYSRLREAGGKGQKAKLTSWCMEAFGMDYSTARAVADIYL